MVLGYFMRSIVGDNVVMHLTFSQITCVEIGKFWHLRVIHCKNFS